MRRRRWKRLSGVKADCHIPRNYSPPRTPPASMGGKRTTHTGKTVHAVAGKASVDAVAVAKGEERAKGKG